MSDDFLKVEIEHRVALVTFNRPATRNTLSSAALHQLDQILTELFSDYSLMGIVFTGAGGTFLSGADISEIAALSESTARSFSKLGQDVIQKIAGARPKTIAAINGYCIGGGMDLALACDVRIAAANATFAHPGARLGIITGWGGTQRLPRLIGQSRALEIFLTARRFGSAEALQLGLVSEVWDPVVDRALALAGAQS